MPNRRSHINQMKGRVAVIGAVGTRGQMILKALADYHLPPESIVTLDYGKYVGNQIPYGVATVSVQDMMSADFQGIRVVLLCLSGVLRAYVDDIIRAGAIVIDCIGIVAEAPCVLADTDRPIIPRGRMMVNPTDMTIALARVLKPIQQSFAVRSVEVTALLSAGIFGESAKRALQIQSHKPSRVQAEIGGPFRLWQAYNLIPEIDPYLARQTIGQMKELFHFFVSVCTCLTPVFRGEAYSLNITTRKAWTPNQLEQVLNRSEGCRLYPDSLSDFPPTTADCMGCDTVLITRPQIIPFRDKTCHLWAVCDAGACGSAVHAARLTRYLLS